ncbi:hypothetical protein TNCV_2430141 [Trichonephila clavipes]|nr:hypothetical protein TNCV_2430141 [Trichonephila clavipes]
MRQSWKVTVDMSDVSISTLRTMLAYIYTGKIDDLTMSMLKDLLCAADKYQLTRLKNICSEYLKSNINDQNVLSLLEFGNSSDRDLKDFAMSFI